MCRKFALKLDTRLTILAVQVEIMERKHAGTLKEMKEAAIASRDQLETFKAKVALRSGPPSHRSLT